MILIRDTKDCCGCGACVQRCPRQCIAMHEDHEGFLYPKIDENICINCSLCEKVCPIVSQSEPRKPIHVYAAKNPDEEVRMLSSSGGIFTMLAEQTIKAGGVVFGARFDANWEVEHSYVTTLDGVAAFRGSKYVQSRIGSTYQQAEAFLKEGREVLFSGTPCQIAGLKKFLFKEYSNLLAVDLVCHGVPSPLVWRKYLEEIMRPLGAVGKNSVLSSLDDLPVITGISFRDKKTGWKKFGFEIRLAASKAAKNSVLKSGNHNKKEWIYLHEILDENIFMQGFLKNLYLRPSCHACAARTGKSGSDITIADYWGIDRYIPVFDDDKGVGLILISTKQGLDSYAGLNLNQIETSYAQALSGNPCMERSVSIPKYRRQFWTEYEKEGVSAIEVAVRKMQPSYVQKALNILKKRVKQLIDLK